MSRVRRARRRSKGIGVRSGWPGCGGVDGLSCGEGYRMLSGGRRGCCLCIQASMTFHNINAFRNEIQKQFLRRIYTRSRNTHYNPTSPPQPPPLNSPGTTAPLVGQPIHIAPTEHAIPRREQRTIKVIILPSDQRRVRRQARAQHGQVTAGREDARPSRSRVGRLCKPGPGGVHVLAQQHLLRRGGHV